MEGRSSQLNALDRLYLARAVELAARGVGNTSPNPPVGAVIVRDGATVGEGYHHRAGEAHAEVLALREAGERARGATMYVTLEPCNHTGRTPPCAPAVALAGIARVVAGAADPNPKTGGAGIAYLRERGIDVQVVDDPAALALVEAFAVAIRGDRPFVTLKLAMSLDGYVASEPGVRQWLTSPQSRELVRELRIAHDAVLVGAGTVRVDDPLLTVRPAHHRLRPYVRVVACERAPVPAERRIFEAVEGYERTIVLAPAGLRAAFAPLAQRANLLFVGDEPATALDLPAALRALRAAGIQSVLCEGGPTLAGRLLAARTVDRLVWLVAPALLRAPRSVPVLAGAHLAQAKLPLHFERVERLGADALILATVEHV